MLPPACVYLRFSSPQSTAIVSKRKLFNGFGMWASNVSSVLEGCYYIVGAPSKQRMSPSREHIYGFLVGKTGLWALGWNQQVPLSFAFNVPFYQIPLYCLAMTYIYFFFEEEVVVYFVIHFCSCISCSLLS